MENITVTLGARFNGTTEKGSITIPMTEIESRPALKAAILKAGVYALASSMKNDAGVESPVKFAHWIATVDAAALAAALAKPTSSESNYTQAERIADARSIIQVIPALATKGILLMLPGVDFPALVQNKNLPALAARDNSAVLENWSKINSADFPEGFDINAFRRVKTMLEGFQSMKGN